MLTYWFFRLHYSIFVGEGSILDTPTHYFFKPFLLNYQINQHIMCIYSCGHNVGLKISIT